MFIAKILYQY